MLSHLVWVVRLFYTTNTVFTVSNTAPSANSTRRPWQSTVDSCLGFYKSLLRSLKKVEGEKLICVNGDYRLVAIYKNL